MSKENAKAYLDKMSVTEPVQFFDESSATVELAAQRLGVAPEIIAKTMALRLKDRDIVLVTCGGARIDNQKYKQQFGCKAKMIHPEELETCIGHPMGGVCPFGVKEGVGIYLDRSLLQFEVVYPAAGEPNSAIKMTPQELERVSCGKWVDVCALKKAE